MSEYLIKAIQYYVSKLTLINQFVYQYIKRYCIRNTAVNEMVWVLTISVNCIINIKMPFLADRHDSFYKVGCALRTDSSMVRRTHPTGIIQFVSMFIEPGNRI